MEDLYYVIVENGYHIFSKSDEFFHVYQYEPYIPDHDLSYEQNAINQIAEMMEGGAE